MPLEITFTLSDNDLERFQEIVDKARSSMRDPGTAKQVEQAARALIAEANEGDLPEFISTRIAKLDVVIDMINDEEWQLSEQERRQILSALAYLCDPDDLIPDHIPGIGFLDDAIYTEIVLGELSNEISLFQEFCTFREAEEQRRAARGEDLKVGREEWLCEKRASLHAKMRSRRAGGGRRQGSWRMRIW
jgi:uncharacterized membrane protein YkvA (DUF1232 family)